jgi:hypothetical protein
MYPSFISIHKPVENVEDKQAFNARHRDVWYIILRLTQGVTPFRAFVT